VYVLVCELYLVSGIQEQIRVVARSERDGDGDVYLSIVVDHQQLFHHIPATSAASATDTSTDVACQLYFVISISVICLQTPATTREAIFSVASVCLYNNNNNNNNNNFAHTHTEDDL